MNYYLDETQNWALDSKDLEKRIEESKKKGTKLRCIVVINPGNPTGQVLTKDNIKEIIKICHRENILIIADEVYQNNIYKEGVQFHSFRKILNELGGPYSNDVELISLNSVSKGLMGECGLRGGYFETHNIDPFVESQLVKLKSIELCSNTIG